MPRSLRFLLNNETVEITSIDPTMTVLDWLRLERRLTGTKEGCNEGDCGACTVVIGRIEQGELVYRSVNACIQLLGSLDSCQLLTVEHLSTRGGPLDPVQQAMVDCHGSQCGFCTPGFVMSIYALTKNHDEVPSDLDIDDALAGNLCRCTGYAPIARAVEQAFVNGRPRRIDEPIRDRLLAMQDGEDVRIGDGKRCFDAPGNLSSLTKLLADHPNATIAAGCTDVGLWITKQMRQLPHTIWIGRVEELQRIDETPKALEIGGGVTWSNAMSALCRLYPEMSEMLRRFSSTQIRNTATVGGNIANGSPIGDGPPAMIAAGATLHLRHGDTLRSIPLEDFFIAYGKQDRKPGELVERISVPRPATDSHYRCYKISKRFDQDISAVLGAFMIRMDDGIVVKARLAFGGMAATPKRAAHAEAALLDEPWDSAAVEAACTALANDFTPLTDMRSSANYRLRVAGNLLRRMLVETSEPDMPTRLTGEESLAHV